MSIKKTAPGLATESGLVQQMCTSRKDKDTDYPALFQRVRQQEQKISACLAEPTEKGKTRMRIALETGIERANVCRRVAELRKEGQIWSCGRHLDSITGCRAEHLTTDKHTCFEHFLRITEGIWAALPTEDERHEMQDAIWQYVIERKTELDFFGLNTSAVREMWDEVKAAINKEAGL